MASEKRWVLERVPPGPGKALDLGGGDGELHRPLTDRGYEYVNLDIAAEGPGAVVGDAHTLPFEDESFDVVVSSDSLEHFHTPLTALREARRVLRDGGLIVVWVPFLHPFHQNDFYRYSPLGLEYLFDEAGFTELQVEAPLGPLSILATWIAAVLYRLRLGRIGGPFREAVRALDGRLRNPNRLGFAAFYRVVARR